MQQLKYLSIILLMAACGAPENTPQQEDKPEPKEVNIYTKRHYDSDKELYQLFTEKTGIEVNVIQSESSGSLMERMLQEGKNSPCDVLITSDAGNLGTAKSKGLLQSIESETLTQHVPAQYRDPDGQWFGISVRARIIAYNNESVDPGKITDYADLTENHLEGKVLVRSSSNIYNQSLLASMIAEHGEDVAKKWAEGIVRNMAREPKGGDTDQLKAVAAGQGDVAIANSYYLARLASSNKPENKAIADKLGVIFPKSGEFGTHVNISGAGVAAYSPNKESAVAFLEFLLSEEAQHIIAETNNEYPVRDDVPLPSVLEKWGDFQRDDLPLAKLHEFNAAASRIFDEVGWK